MQMGHVQDILLLAAALCRLKLQQSSTVKNCKEKLLKVPLVLYQFQDAKQSSEMYSELLANTGFGKVKHIQLKLNIKLKIRSGHFLKYIHYTNSYSPHWLAIKKERERQLTNIEYIVV